jgi:hypothetical protein
MGTYLYVVSDFLRACQGEVPIVDSERFVEPGDFGLNEGFRDESIRGYDLL